MRMLISLLLRGLGICIIVIGSIAIIINANEQLAIERAVDRVNKENELIIIEEFFDERLDWFEGGNTKCSAISKGEMVVILCRESCDLEV